MDSIFINGRAALSDAVELIDRFGEEAALEAALRAERSRDADNILKFCHWRQIERLIDTLASEQPQGTVH